MARTLTKEVLLLTASVVEITRDQFCDTMELQNLGPNAIWIALDDPALCVENKCRKIAVGEAWTLTLPTGMKVYGRASTANQVTGAATIVSQTVPK